MKHFYNEISFKNWNLPQLVSPPRKAATFSRQATLKTQNYFNPKIDPMVIHVTLNKY